MKLLSSDYDGTLNVLEYDLWLNLSFIKKFMKDNIFVLNTGRAFESIKKEINKYQIPYHYLSCNDGNLLLNNQNEIIYSTNMSIDINDLLLSLKEKFPDIEIEPIIFQDKILEYQIITSKITNEFLYELNKLCLYNDLSYKTFRILNKRFIFVTDKTISKSTSINKVSELEKIEKCDIFTIGDDLNDLEMIRDFNGYTFPWGKKELKESSQGICLSVGSLVKKITR